MKADEADKIAYLKIDRDAKSDDLYILLKQLSLKGFKYVFIDEVTLLEDFAKLNSVSKRTVNNWLHELKMAGLIRSEIIRNEFNRQVEKRKIFIKMDFSVMHQTQSCTENTSNDEKTKLIFHLWKRLYQQFKSL